MAKKAKKSGRFDPQDLPEERKQRYRERIEAQVSRDRKTGCWFWLGAAVSRRPTNPQTWGQMTIGVDGHTYTVYPARLYWELTRGPIRGVLLKTCEGRNCVNPEHYKDGTNTERAQRMWERRRQKGYGGPKLTLEDRRAIVYHHAEGTSASFLADVYGVTKKYIWEVSRKGRRKQ